MGGLWYRIIIVCGKIIVSNWLQMDYENEASYRNVM